jgi:carbamoyl-phosphate synthase large subunit
MSSCRLAQVPAIIAVWIWASPTPLTLHDPELEDLARRVATGVGLRETANIQFRRNAHGMPVLLDVNAHFPGTMPPTVHSAVDMPLLSPRDVLGHQ